jgi:anaerobic ribonucleoside-triphosphate reductase activating protein
MMQRELRRRNVSNMTSNSRGLDPRVINGGDREADAESYIRVAGIENDSIVDGPGLRFTLFVQGCTMNCPGCHNPEARPLEGGTLYTPNEILDFIRANPLLTGVTFSGGEPLRQARVLVQLAAKLIERRLPLAVYTGELFEDILAEWDPSKIALIGLSSVLIDGPFLIEERNLSIPFRGSTNQRILDSKGSLLAERPVFATDASWWCNDQEVSRGLC